MTIHDNFLKVHVKYVQHQQHKYYINLTYIRYHHIFKDKRD